MRCVKKRGDGGFNLNKSHQKPPQTDKEATSRWKSFRHHKPEVLAYLLTEQYQLCCYSELRADQHELGYHIEHLENKSQHPQRTFDYSNLAASALESDALQLLPNIDPQHDAQIAPSAVAFGGHASLKQHAVDMQQMIVPHQTDCARFFFYLSDGRIVPTYGLTAQERARAQYTIDLLNLNSPFLVTERKNCWHELDALFSEHLAEDMDLYHLAAVDLLPINQRLNPFFSLTRQFFGRIAEDVIRHNAPELL